MKKIDRKKLVLQTQTIRELSKQTLQTVIGGVAGKSDQCQVSGGGNIYSAPAL